MARRHDGTTARRHDGTTARRHDGTTALLHLVFATGLMTACQRVEVSEAPGPPNIETNDYVQAETAIIPIAAPEAAT